MATCRGGEAPLETARQNPGWHHRGPPKEPVAEALKTPRLKKNGSQSLYEVPCIEISAEVELEEL